MLAKTATNQSIAMNYSTNQTRLLAAGWVFTGTGQALRHGGVLFRGDKILDVLPESAWRRLLESEKLSHEYLQRAILSPGLFNLHTHLDYTDASSIYIQWKSMDPGRPQNLFAWLKDLVSLARTWKAEDFQTSAGHGARELALAGVTHCADSSYTGEAARALAATGLKGLVGLELFGLDPERAEANFQGWLKRFAALEADPLILEANRESRRITLTVAPHAPYTVAPDLWQLARNFAASRNLTVLAHLAESKQECAWLKASASLAPTLNEETLSLARELDAYLTWITPPGSRPDLLQTLPFKDADRSPTTHLAAHTLLDENLLAAHLVEMSPQDIDCFAKSGARAALCPRSNSTLGNNAAAAEALEKAGVPFALGTDSRASSPDLCPRAEATFFNNGRQRPLEARHLHRLITLEAARVLAVEEHTGSLTKGKQADLAIFETTEDLADEEASYKQFFAESTRLKNLFVDGRQVVSDGELVFA